MKKYFKNIGKAFLILLAVLFVLYTSLYFYILANKQKIITKVKNEVKEKVQGDLQIGNIELSFFHQFPYASVLIENVSITDSLYKVHQHPFFTAKKIYARISLLKVIRKFDPLTGIRVEDGSIYMFTDTSGYTNQYLLTLKQHELPGEPEEKKGNVIEKIELVNMRLVMENQVKNKLYDIEAVKWDCEISTKENELILSTENDLIIHSLAFKLRKGSYVKESSFTGDFYIIFDKLKKQLRFDKIPVEIKKHPFILSGIFNFDGSKSYTLQVSTKKILYDFAKSLLPIRINNSLSKFEVEKPVDVEASIVGFLAPGGPKVDVTWVSEEPNYVSTPFAEIENATFSGSYTNEVEKGKEREDPNSRVRFQNFTGDWEGITIRSKNIDINNLSDPMLHGDFTSDFKLSQLNNLLQSSSIAMNKGDAKLSIVYIGPLSKNAVGGNQITGYMQFKDAELFYRPRQITMQDGSGKIIFGKTDVFVKNLKVKVLNTRLLVNGKGENLVSLMNTDPGKIKLDWSVYSPSLNLENFTRLLQQRQQVKQKSVKGGALQNVANKVDDMLDQSALSIQLKTPELLYKKFKATDVDGSIALVKDDWDLNNISLMHGNGYIKIKGELKETDARYSRANLFVNMDNVDVSHLLASFNNFGQDAIESQNLQGRLHTDVKVQMKIDRELQTDPTELNGYIDFTLTKGALLNFEPIQKLQTFLFKNRNFEQVYFAELKDRFELKGREIKINRMAITSTALNLFVEGVYSLDGKTDLSIQVPLKNLKKRKDNQKLKDIENDARGGMSVFLRGKPGKDGNIEFKLDVLHKVKKVF